jgi:hypothetical protein
MGAINPARPSIRICISKTALGPRKQRQLRPRLTRRLALTGRNTKVVLPRAIWSGSRLASGHFPPSRSATFPGVIARALRRLRGVEEKTVIGTVASLRRKNIARLIEAFPSRPGELRVR